MLQTKIHSFCKYNFFSAIILEKISASTNGILNSNTHWEYRQTSQHLLYWQQLKLVGALTKIRLDLFLKTSTSKKIRTAFKLKCQVFWKYTTEQIIFGMGRIKNDWERSKIKGICKQPPSYCIFAGFSLIPRLALNQAILQGSQGCRIITCSGISPGEMFHVLPQQSQPLHWRFPALFYSCLRLHNRSLFPLDFVHEKQQPRPLWLYPTLHQDKTNKGFLSARPQPFQECCNLQGTKQALAIVTVPCISCSSSSAGKFLQQNNIIGLQDLVLKLTVLETDALVRRSSQISWTEGQKD